MRRLIVSCCLVILLIVSTAAQDAEPDLLAVDVSIGTAADSFGVERPFASGLLQNNTAQGYTNINLVAQAYDSNDTLIGEGIGFVVDACGQALLDLTLQPGEQTPFQVQLETFEADVTINHVIVQADGDTSDVSVPPPPAPVEGINKISTGKVVQMEWLSETSLIYSTGCYRDVFSNRPWYAYSLETGETTAVDHPRAGDITPEMLQAIELGDPVIYNRSFLYFAPGQRRSVYQTELNTLVSAEPDGTFRRLLYDALFNITLQGIHWHKTSGTAMAYYHGGDGDEVLYLLTNADGRQFSQHPINAIPSKIVPGFAANGMGLVIGATIDGVTGYYLKVPSNETTIFMFESELPGNNWPAPWYEITADGQRWIYIVRPVDGEARLQCFNPGSAQLHDYTSLPLNLNPGERASMWLSPENSRMALAANGVHGGLWLIDMTRFEACT